MQQSAQEIVPRRIGKYEVLGELGHGGMAVVYRARDTQLLRDVAVKVLHPHLANDPESRQRFLREAQAAARLRHPNIVEVYDFSVDGDRDSFMVSELLEGPTLRRFAEQHPGMPAEIAAAIGVVLCDALACAHAQGVIHRDVKPDNILLQTGGVLKLTDFGIAHVADGNGMTVTGQVLGSPAHMAPEQIEGARIDARADLFAAGTVLYALAVGRLPFEAPHPHALLRKILEADYPDPLRIAPAIGHRFAAIIRRCLEREPSKRYDSANDLRAALVAFASESGWEKTDTKLVAYFEDPEGFAKSHREVLLARLPELGVKARREGRIVDALGYFNRALALDSTNVKVLALVRGISRRRQMKRAATGTAVVVAAAALTAGMVVLAARKLRDMGPAPPLARAVVLPDGESVRHALVPAHVEPTVVHTEPPTVPPEPVLPPQPVDVANTVRAAISTPRSARPVTSGSANTRNAGAHPVGPVATLTGQVLRVVHIRVHGAQGFEIGIDGRNPVPVDEQALQPELRVGVPHQIRIVPNSGPCNEMTQTVTVNPGELPQDITIQLRCTGHSVLPNTTAADSSQ